MGRYFSEHQRWDIYDKSNGCCALCGIRLYGYFEVDHKIPFSLGGETTLDNAQILCRRCNRKKGKKMAVNPSIWQEEVREKYATLMQENFLIAACPGAGKTIAALLIAFEMIKEKMICKRLIIVTPSVSLISYWTHEAAKLGLELNERADSNIASNRNGYVVTYQEIAAQNGRAMQIIAADCQHYNTFVILDEPHHLGKSKQWAESALYAFKYAKHRLLLTGTPFRSDNNEIPYVRYEQSDDWKISVPDYTYPYGRGLSNGVVRPVFFETYDGPVSWFKDGEAHTEIISDDSVPKYKQLDLRRHTFDIEGDWFNNVICEANRNLDFIRTETAPNAGGLIVVSSKWQAYAVAEQMRCIFGGNGPVVIVSDDSEEENRKAGIDLERFKNSREPWVVAVKKISEGVDIPRLRILVYATTTTTELFFIQVIGRVIRLDRKAKDPVDEQCAYAYIPKFPDIQQYAKRIEEQRDHVLIPESEDIDSPQNGSGDRDRTRGFSSFLSSDGKYSGQIHSGIEIPPEYIAEARQDCLQLALTHEQHVFAIAKFKMGLGVGLFQEAVRVNHDRALYQDDSGKKAKIPEYEQVREMTRRGGAIHKKIGVLVSIITNGSEDKRLKNNAWQAIGLALNKAQGVDNFTAPRVTLDQCYERIAILDGWIEQGRIIHV